MNNTGDLFKTQFDRTQVFVPVNSNTRYYGERNYSAQPYRNTASTYQRRVKQQEEFVDISNGYVDYSDIKIPKKINKKRRTAVALSLIIAVLIFVFGTGFFAFTYFSEFEYRDNVYVNDICLGGMTEDEAKVALKKAENKLEDSINITVSANDKATTLTKDDVKCTFDTERVLRQAKMQTKNQFFSKGEKRYTISAIIDKESVAKVSEKVANDLRQSPSNARVTKFDSSKKGPERFVCENGNVGVEVDKNSVERQLKDFISSGKLRGEIEAEFSTTAPKCTKEELVNNIKELSHFTTTTTDSCSENSKSNMKLAATMCNNSIINPGEIWSFNNCTGDSSLESNGFSPAPVYIDGELDMGIGGGICQTSSTIYNAGLFCGLNVMERLPHARPSQYVPVGLDATIDYGNIDLKLQNAFDYQLFMECYMEGDQVHCKFYGLQNPDFDKVEVTSSSTSGSTAIASRVFYKNGVRVTGANLPDEELPSSSYLENSISGYGDSDSSDVQADEIPDVSEDVSPTPTPVPETQHEEEQQAESTPEIDEQEPEIEPDFEEDDSELDTGSDEEVSA